MKAQKRPRPNASSLQDSFANKEIFPVFNFFGGGKSIYNILQENIVKVFLVGFLKGVFGKEEKKKHNLGVCIPDASRKKRRAKDEAGPEAKDKAFRVSGIFHVHESLMVQGHAIGATIKPKDKIRLGEAELVVTDVQINKASTERLEPGEQGALFLRSLKGKFPIIRIGDVLEF